MGEDVACGVAQGGVIGELLQCGARRLLPVFDQPCRESACLVTVGPYTVQGEFGAPADRHVGGDQARFRPGHRGDQAEIVGIPHAGERGSDRANRGVDTAQWGSVPVGTRRRDEHIGHREHVVEQQLADPVAEWEQLEDAPQPVGGVALVSFGEMEQEVESGHLRLHERPWRLAGERLGLGQRLTCLIDIAGKDVHQGTPRSGDEAVACAVAG